ncbi:AfsR/SARP family transcriptional regulator [Nocardia bovistercoris]|uniref:Bacterial transcriptional activator domain-containing protein n=1 Tax=Nocardia bovistercoris TaxID=2785916 RepID=A0A931I624_9NOCA|nr:BTAD domain-containing putative transcriptional regulator [Nocardia bovistercoris]MBH0775542.1 hypothetical protein [Nocardia bovistercoris]
MNLTGEFALIIAGRERMIPRMAERVVAYLALADRAVARSRLAGTLWPDTPPERAAKSLRSALWRLHSLGVDLIGAHDDRLRLDPTVSIDLGELTVLAHKLIHGPCDPVPAELSLLVATSEVLPDWDEEWIVADRERYRLVRLQALERAAIELLHQQRHHEALFTASAAVGTEPLRETARRIVIDIHIAQGNIAAALREYRSYHERLADEFGVPPSADLRQLIDRLGGDVAVTKHGRFRGTPRRS